MLSTERNEGQGWFQPNYPRKAQINLTAPEEADATYHKMHSPPASPIRLTKANLAGHITQVQEYPYGRNCFLKG